MSLPSYVLNWDELINALKGMDGGLNLDFSSLTELLEKYFPDIIELLKALVDNTKKPSGTQKMKGYHKQVISNKAYTFLFTPEEDVMLTGITYAQSIYKCDDRFDLIVVNDSGEELTLFDGLYVKDAMQHKLFQVFFPVPKGYEVKLVMHNQSARTKDVWVDFEYLGVKSLDATKGTVIIRYLAEGENDFDLLAEETLSLDLGVHTISNIKDFEGYTKLEPTVKMISLTTEEPTRIVEFFYEKNQSDIGHAYDLKVTLRWENNSPVDIDMYGYIDQNHNRQVNYRQKEYFETEEDRMWLDYDFTRHGPNGYEEEPEVLTVLGFKRSILSIQLQNFNSRELTEDALIEIATDRGTILETITISKSLLNQSSTRNLYVCDINLETRAITQLNKSIGSVGEF